ncbi:thiamine phosphate synthase [Ramlibacter sp. AW1]|uniref:Thiamine phosphate synthase n=1 Tax=Ramlibacter aurantiacus TaxID=2801330 RepID=A0A936ZQS6_9BURK|nr:thiamine phosphate synthase [Ramlibacter aurantiacus]MBL0421996.1 thiamine phosphate synthase [Ramlibacter aurantiacus]
MPAVPLSFLHLLTAPDMPASRVPALAAATRAERGGTVCVRDVPQAGGGRLHWLDAAHARGWIEAPAPLDPLRLQDGFDRANAAGFVGADALLLACMPEGGWVLPRLSWGESPRFAAPRMADAEVFGIYALVDCAERLAPVLAAGVRTVQLRRKTPAHPDAAWRAELRQEVARCIELAREAGAQLFVNDHWELALELGAAGVHLGQEDVLALGDAGRERLLASGVALGLSSHSVWELCRARALSPRYIACGPVWPTTTKDMPWIPQGLDNLGWWCRMAGAPVVAIGGILQAAQVRDTAAAGAAGVCIVRGLGPEPGQVLPGLLAAFEAGRAARTAHAADWPHPTLPPEHGA